MVAGKGGMVPMQNASLMKLKMKVSAQTGTNALVRITTSDATMSIVSWRVVELDTMAHQ
jgi:hypothetical protein